MASIYHVKKNGVTLEVVADTASEAIINALVVVSDNPDQCLTDGTTGICICAEYAGETVEAVVE